MAIAKTSHQNFNKGWSITTGAGTYELPRSDVDSLYGPGWPVQPVVRPEDSELPRSIDYPVGINYTLQPRVGYAGLMPIAALKAAYSNIAEVSSPVNLIIREMASFMAMLRDPKTKQKLKPGHPYNWMTITPDRSTPFNVWLTKYKKSAKIYAAPAFYMKRENGSITGMEYIDGSTLFLIINSRGNLPKANELDEEVLKFAQRIQYGISNGDARVLTGMPELARSYLAKQQERVSQGKPLVTTTPAYTQIIKGVPFSFWDQDQVYFVPEPPASAVDSPYGETYIERAWTWINIIATMTAFELAHYRTGNTPEGLMMMPKDMFPSMSKLATGEREWNARMAEGSQVQHARNRWMPEGTQYVPTKAPDFPKELYEQAKKNILYAIGMPPSEMGDKPGAGLGGKGFSEGAANDVTRQLLEAEKESLEDSFNYVLRKDGVTDAEFYLDYPQEQIDPSKQQEDLWNKFSRGVSTLNDVLTEQGKTPIGDPADLENVANMHLIIAGTTIFVLEKVKPDEAGIIATKPPPAQNPFGGDPNSPQNPEDLIQGDKKGLPPKKGFPQQLARKIEELGGLSTVTYSFPPLNKSVDFDSHEYDLGLIEEQEHAETVDNDQEVIAQIVEDHLREDPHYYTHFKEAEEAGIMKRDITDHDGSMIALFMPQDVAQQLRDIADSLELPEEAEQELPENMHVTLTFFPEAPGANKEVILALLQRITQEYTPLNCKVQGYGIFNGSEGKKVLYASLDCVDLAEIRTEICQGLDNLEIPYSEDHGFTPHITMAYVPIDWNLPEGFIVPDIATQISNICFCLGDERNPLSFGGSGFAKHCGVCPEDAEYAYAPLMHDNALAISPKRHRANGVEVVTMQPKGLPAQLALWKPAGQEKDSLNESIGGVQYVREEAAWLLDQSLGFHLVPLAYVGETPEGEEGAAIWYTAGNTQRKKAEEYAYDWVEKAAVFDYIITQLDRRGKNFLTHPDEPSRMILIDNGYAFPSDKEKHSNTKSDFASFMVDKPLSEDVLNALRKTMMDLSMWQDLEDLIGKAATDNVRECTQELIDKGKMRLQE